MEVVEYSTVDRCIVLVVHCSMCDEGMQLTCTNLAGAEVFSSMVPQVEATLGRVRTAVDEIYRCQPGQWVQLLSTSGEILSGSSKQNIICDVPLNFL